ncbi:uncharacterized protein LOC115885193 [Sitophilus oryzae]|uniref:Uncharacterized protein LOC115885193 n=1 Tax=Sitophilus oryzae TaxID=7048 RepID=A0A6J2Y7T4_SITOR|nr:uncharacterized protein LOC115885193 [Sitophilus oryzae]
MLRATRKTFIILIVIVLLSIQEAECRRKILRGRKTVTRRYMKPLLLPAWAIITLVAIGQLIIGALFYLLLKVTILDKPLNQRYSAAPMSLADERQTA